MQTCDVMEDTIAVPVRNYRTVMKPRLPRKITSSARINLNRFWNELEEFYNRYDDRKAKCNNNNSFNLEYNNLPAYTTDIFDHQRETAENRLNERLESFEDTERLFENEFNEKLEAEAKTDSKVLLRGAQPHMRGLVRQRLQSYEDLEAEYSSDEYSSSIGDSRPNSPMAIWNVFDHGKSASLPSPPPLPKTLADIANLMSKF